MFNRSWIRNLSRSRSPLTIRKAPYRFRPVVQPLENRWVPATILVTNATDTPAPGQIDLRQAIATANGATEATTIEFAPGIDEIKLPGDALGTNGLQLTNVNYPITIDGASVHNVRVTTSTAQRNDHINHIFFVATGVQATFKSLVIAGGFNEDPIVGGGAGLLNYGTVNMTNCAFIGNKSLFGGALENWGTATVSNCRFSANHVSPTYLSPVGSGGAILNRRGATITLNSTAISDNSASAHGGGMYNLGAATLNDCTISGNTAGGNGGGFNNAGIATLNSCNIQDNHSSFGGGLYNLDSKTTTLNNCVITSNTASRSGGGLWSNGRASLNTCTVQSNSAENGGGLYNNAYVVLTNCTVSNNSASGDGGGLSNLSTVILLDSTITGNAAPTGGGVYNGRLALLTNCTVTSNTAANSGGGMFNSGTANLNNCTVRSNTATAPDGGYGGGLYNSGTATLTGSTVDSNTATYAGGGLYSHGTVTLTNCTVSSNAATSCGAGLYNDGTAQLVSSTFVKNDAGTSSSQGGGLYNNDSATLQSCTFAYNQAEYGGGLFDNDRLSLINTIVAKNIAYSGSGHDITGAHSIASGTMSLGHNLIGDTTDSYTEWLSTDLTGGDGAPLLDPMLGPLVNNGGPTQTMALLPGSPAINHGTRVPGITTDQRSIPLPKQNPDIGAFQTQGQTPSSQVPALAVGAGSGMEPRVNVYDGAGTLIRSFNAYESSFRGGVHVVTADVNGDNIPDTITAPGFGGGPVVRIWDGANGSLVNEFNAYDPQFRGGVNLAVARLLDTLGSPQIITGAGPSGGPHVKVFNLQTGAVLAGFLAYEPSFTGGISVAATAATPGGPGQIITGAGPGGGPHVRVFSSTGEPQGPGFMAYDLAFTGGVNVAALQNADIITAPASRGGPVIREFSLSGNMIQQFLAYDAAFVGGVSLGVIPFGPDSGSAIVTGAGFGGGPHVKQFETGNLSTPSHSFMAFDPVFTGGVFVG